MFMSNLHGPRLTTFEIRLGNHDLDVTDPLRGGVVDRDSDTPESTKELEDGVKGVDPLLHRCRE